MYISLLTIILCEKSLAYVGQTWEGLTCLVLERLDQRPDSAGPMECNRDHNPSTSENNLTNIKTASLPI
jgi:hypothetical protein